MTARKIDRSLLNNDDSCLNTQHEMTLFDFEKQVHLMLTILGRRICKLNYIWYIMLSYNHYYVFKKNKKHIIISLSKEMLILKESGVLPSAVQPDT